MTKKELYGVHQVASFRTKRDWGELKKKSEWMFEYKGFIVMFNEWKNCWMASVWEKTNNKTYHYNKLFEMEKMPAFTAYGLKQAKLWALECIDEMAA